MSAAEYKQMEANNQAMLKKQLDDLDSQRTRIQTRIRAIRGDTDKLAQIQGYERILVRNENETKLRRNILNNQFYYPTKP